MFIIVPFSIGSGLISDLPNFDKLHSFRGRRLKQVQECETSAVDSVVFISRENTDTPHIIQIIQFSKQLCSTMKLFANRTQDLQ